VLSVLLPLTLAPACLVQEQRVVERDFNSELQLATDSFEIEAAEEGKSAAKPGPLLRREEAFEVEAEDTLLDDEEPPAKFTRFYRTVMSSLSLTGDKKPIEKTVSAGLEGKRVTFERNEDRYERSCDDPEVRQVQLNRLRADLSLARFLPPEDEDDASASYTVPFATFLRLMAPLEDRPRRPHAKADAPPGGLNLAPTALTEPMAVLLSGAEGELTVTPRARGKDDDLPRNAELAFRFEGTFDGSATLLAAGPGEAEDEVEVVYSGKGSLAWDPEDGRVALHCEGDLRLNETFKVSVEANGTQGRARGRLRMTGTLELEASEKRGE
jgi:hypothetical protein